MRIGLVTADFWPNVGGVAAHAVELGRALVQLGHEVHALTRPLGTETSPRSELYGMQVHRPDLTRLRPFSHWALHRWLASFLQSTPLDLLHVHGLRPLPATKGLDVPVVFTNHTSGFLQRLERGDRARKRVARWIDSADLVLAPSEQLVEATLSLSVSCPVRYVPNGVDPQRFTPGQSSVRTRLGIGDDETVVLLARRLVAKNGVKVFAEAAREFVRPGVRIVFAGDGPERKEVESILRRDGVHNSALFLGNVLNTEMPDIYRAADMSVLPSFLEATSITGLESMATGLPLVGTRVGGIPALIADGETGLLVDPGKPSQLAAAIRRLCDDQTMRRAFGAAGRERVLREFSWLVVAATTAGFYERVQCVGRGILNFDTSRLRLSRTGSGYTRSQSAKEAA
ncbi:MAG: glycosyltransferase family 4 protein [Planctomycetaceae bacterium]|nr:glycosyltransferase family 4 protein [Planctomycetaceae bacterium]